MVACLLAITFILFIVIDIFVLKFNAKKSRIGKFRLFKSLIRKFFICLKEFLFLKAYLAKILKED